MKLYMLLIVFLVATSCIPLKTAPKIKDYKISIAKDIHRKLPKEYVFIFEDPKDADEFYNYLDIKYKRNSIDVMYNIPFTIDGITYYMSTKEIELTDKRINILPIATDMLTHNSDFSTDLSDNYTSRKNHWYIGLIVLDEDFNNCLEPTYLFRQIVVDYLKQLKEEYLTTHNYEELALKNP